MLNYTKEELTKLIYEDKISYRELGRMNGVCDTYKSKNKNSARKERYLRNYK